MEQSIQKVQTEPLAVQQESPIMRLADKLSKGEITAEQMEKMLDIQIKYEANEARKAYHEAMTAFKANPPVITKDKRVVYGTSKGQTDYNHASLANVSRTINEALSKHGLSASWTQSQSDGQMTVTCKITHILGHSEQTSMTAPPDSSGSKNPIQALASTVTYLERYTLLALTGLATEEDDDGRAGYDNKPKVPEPTEHEQMCIAAIGDSLPCPAGKEVDLESLALFFYNTRKKYPCNPEKIKEAVEFVVQRNPKDIYKEMK